MAEQIGRPSSFTQEIADEICERLADGESLRSICDGEAMPNKATVFRWLAVNEDFRDQYARARETQADALFDDVLQIADDGRNDWMARLGEGDAGWTLNGEHIQRSKLRIDARKWMAGKLRPKVYGEKQEIEHSGKMDINGDVDPRQLSRAILAVLGEAVVHKRETVVHAEPAAVVHKGKSGKARYRDQDARRAYRREWMRRQRNKP